MRGLEERHGFFKSLDFSGATAVPSEEALPSLVFV